MKISRHGGQCCGMRHIHGMGQPAYIWPALAAAPEPPVPNQFRTGAGNINSLAYSVAQKAWCQKREELGCYTKAAPAESSLDRLRRLLMFCETTEKRKGIIEVVVAGSCKGSQSDLWKPHLEALGFNLVTESRNSTSANTVYVWHYKAGVGNIGKLGKIDEVKVSTPTAVDTPVDLQIPVQGVDYAR